MGETTDRKVFEEVFFLIDRPVGVVDPHKRTGTLFLQGIRAEEFAEAHIEDELD